MKYRRKNLAAKIALLVSLMSSQSVMTPAYAGIPVIDAANLTQTVISAIESVSQTLMQIDQFATQLQQWDNMLQNTALPDQYIWDQAMTTMNQLRATIDTITYYKNALGSIDNYLASFKDLESYRNSPCFTLAGCSPAEWMAMAATDTLGAEAQKKSTDALFRGLDTQQQNIENDAMTLQHLQTAAQDATGHMQALGFANQLASQQSNQLLQIRALLIAEQNVLATSSQVQANREAQRTAASEQLRQGDYVPSAPVSWPIR